MLKKIILATAAIATIASCGDYVNILDKTYYPLAYSEPVDKESYQKPFRLRKRYIVNNKDLLEVQIGRENEWITVKPDLSTKVMGVDEIIILKGKRIKDSLMEWYRGQKNASE